MTVVNFRSDLHRKDSSTKGRQGAHRSLAHPLIRLSVGLEAVDDLLKDLDNALGLAG
jgi:cystathionine beta-lyase/cystathionine gamma-synthase